MKEQAATVSDWRPDSPRQGGHLSSCSWRPVTPKKRRRVPWGPSVWSTARGSQETGLQLTSGKNSLIMLSAWDRLLQAV